MPYADDLQLLRNSEPGVSSDELSGLGKQASLMFLCDDVPLNEAVVKIAREKPGITTEQVKRVVEYANQHTFQQAFEKQAGDKNIEFPIADPHEVLQLLNEQVSPPVVKLASHDYSHPPVRPRYEDLHRDMELAKTFGVDLLPTEAQETVMAKVAEGFPAGPAGMPAPGPTPKVQAAMGILERREESARQRKKMLEQLSRSANGSGAPTPGDAAPGGLGGAIKTASAVREEQAHLNFHEVVRGAVKTAGAHVVSPSGEVVRAESKEHMVSMLSKVAMDAVASDVPGAPLIQGDIEKRASLENLQASIAAQEDDYPMAEPYGDLKRARIDIEKLAESAEDACIINEMNTKEAQAEFEHHVQQHLMNDGGLGELGHFLHSVAEPGLVKAAMKDLEPKIQKLAEAHKIDPVKLNADLIRYEMDKVAHRVVNPDNPIVQSFLGYVKLAKDQKLLEKVRDEVVDLRKEARSLVAKAAGFRV